MNFTLEKYNSLRSRHTCPNCAHQRVFARYVSCETGEYLDSDVGRCNRENKCGYHYTPAEYFRRHPDSDKKPLKPTKRAPLVREKAEIQSPKPLGRSPKTEDQNRKTFFHSKRTLEESLHQNGRNPFYQFLLDLFPDDFAGVKRAADEYFLGYFQGLTCFWQIDMRGRIRKGKLMRYHPESGKRAPVYSFRDDMGKPVEIGAYWVHKVLQKRGEISSSAHFESCFFGEHLLAAPMRRRQTVCIVEAEKTALIASVLRPDFLWLACGARAHLTLEKMRVLKNRNVILYPDGDAYAIWKEKEREFVARAPEIFIRTSDLIERTATPDEKASGFDLADYLIRERRFINQYNAFCDAFNTKVNRIAQDKDLLANFNFAVQERLAIAGLPESEISVEDLRTLVEYIV